jgi:hypothetical protein
MPDYDSTLEVPNLFVHCIVRKELSGVVDDVADDRLIETTSRHDEAQVGCGESKYLEKPA